MVAPLDWGLGHTTRCVPIVKYLLDKGEQVLFAGNSWQRQYIERTFPEIQTIRLDGYDVQYSRSASFFMFLVVVQVPKLLKRIKSENEWLKNALKEHDIKAVISDNRYGLYHPDIPCVIMTHQLQVLSGMGSLIDNSVRRLHYGYLEKFDERWVVDVEEKHGLAGVLSHPAEVPANTRYIGLLSQLERKEARSSNYLLVLLSGPEPQRSLLSELLWGQLKHHKGQVVFVEGSEDAGDRNDVPKHTTYHKQLTKDRLDDVMSGAEYIICRSGYSTVMDIVKLGKKAILIPTPGQTEQEYLGKQLHEQGVLMSVVQSNFDLEKAIVSANKFPYNSLRFEGAYDRYKQSVEDWLNK
ncbi:MAG: glycosyltransferase [Chitinophagales bacterium]|nr:glycosyl transferase family 28 [Chitinophagaceae bacterium]MCB9063902.1 glycosyltransferase [Chitinophagales bacterium]